MTWLAEADPHDIMLPWSVVFEVQLGIERARAKHPALAKEIEAWLEGFVPDSFSQRALPTMETARLRAKMYANPNLQDFLSSPANAKRLKTGEDLMIAATAITHDLVVVTFNVNDFLRIHRAFPLPGLFEPKHGWLIGDPNARDGPFRLSENSPSIGVVT